MFVYYIVVYIIILTFSGCAAKDSALFADDKTNCEASIKFKCNCDCSKDDNEISKISENIAKAIK